ncbi:DUF1499 domain-containing protein [Desulfonatronum thioautotrophicum]|uniref:DUF1499 domain-containing protein n=1 Tax=Desulfonatronum thioautotrophicum TaxID=617001 RepID=UPI0005EB0447|nr:DUF1499 domain-containing protein [Desulfonatronum thioautotrophicum]
MSISLLAALALSMAHLDCPSSPNCVSSMASDPVRRVEPLSYPEGQRDLAMRTLLNLLRNLPRTEIVHEETTIVRAVVRSALFRFQDDLEFHFDPAKPLIHLRSASRSGYWDLGVNRNRIERLRADFDRQMQNT